MFQNKSLTNVTFGFACMLGVTVALDSPCYGYGNIMGSPSKYLEDDLAKVKELKVGEGEVYVANINYLFEGTNQIQLGYKKVGDEKFLETSWPHGSKGNGNFKDYTLRNQDSRILSPGYVSNNTKESLIAFMFVEFFGASPPDERTTLKSEPWTLAAFEPINEPYYRYV